VTIKGRQPPAWLNLAVVLALAGLAILIVRQAAIALRPPGATHTFSAADPLDEAILARLGFEADRRGDRARAGLLIGLAGRLSWRDPPVQAWLLQRAVEAGDWTAAVAHADALLRTDADGASRPQLFRLLDVMASDKTSRAALLVRLRQASWWREAWLAHLAAAAASPTGAVSPDEARAVLIGLASGVPPLTPADYLPYVQMRLARGDYGQAERDWVALARRVDAGSLLRDANFQTPGDSGPFDWSPASGVGASSETEATANGGRVLRLDYDGYSRVRLPGQLLVLAPGPYSFAWRERIVGPARLAWQVGCLGPTPRMLAQSSPLAGPGWRDRRLSFDVGPDCPAQRLELAPQPGERRDEVTGWFAGLALSRRS
jgi:hypothetical protein